MPPAGLNIVKRGGKCVFKCPLKKMQPSCPGSRDLNWTGKGLTSAVLGWVFNCQHMVYKKQCLEHKKIKVCNKWR
jgi:hypothetical protein